VFRASKLSSQNAISLNKERLLHMDYHILWDTRNENGQPKGYFVWARTRGARTNEQACRIVRGLQGSRIWRKSIVFRIESSRQNMEREAYPL
jgi:hypothetical protein